jgi:NADPH:quinone reductase-like Zn-dependent oxidoreductase
MMRTSNVRALGTAAQPGEKTVQSRREIQKGRAMGWTVDRCRAALAKAGPEPASPRNGRLLQVESPGVGVSHVKKGDRVFGRALTGCYAEKNLPWRASETFPLPANLSVEEGAAIPIPVYTAYHAMDHKAALGSGETVLISAGGGGVGVAAIQLAKLAGARGF